jgi:hypothetical protein
MTSKKTKPKAEKLKISSRFKKFEQDLRKSLRAKSQPMKRNRKQRGMDEGDIIRGAMPGGASTAA